MKSNLFSMRLSDKEKSCIQCLAAFMGTDCSSILRHGLRLYLREYFHTIDVDYFLIEFGWRFSAEALGDDEA